MLKRIMYYLWCHDMGFNPKLCESHAKFREYLEHGEVHCGDCTKEPISCIRCHIQGYEISAQNIVDLLEERAKGHCGHNCYGDCPFELKEKDE